jgi:hypothetical protein
MKKLAIWCVPLLLLLSGTLVAAVSAPENELDASPEAWETVLDLDIINEVLDLNHKLHPETAYPEDWAELREFARSLPKSFKQRLPFEDAWGNKFLIREIDGGLMVASPGPDDVFDGDLSEPDSPSLPRVDADVRGDDIVLVVGRGVLNRPRTVRERLNYTMAEIRSAAIAVEEYSIDNNAYPLQDEPLGTFARIRDLLEPMYIRTVPTVDAWGNELIYWSDERSYVIVSPGADGVFDQSYGAGSPTMKYRGEYDDPTVDMVFADGAFVQWPRERRN